MDGKGGSTQIQVCFYRTTRLSYSVFVMSFSKSVYQPGGMVFKPGRIEPQGTKNLVHSRKYLQAMRWSVMDTLLVFFQVVCEGFLDNGVE